MSIFYEPVNVNQWNIFEKVSGVGHVEPFLATKSMELDDIILLHVGSQNKDYQSGIYAFGTVINGPYILQDHPQDYCNNKNTVDVRIDYICRGEPLFSHKEAGSFVHQFRTVHRIEDRYYQQILYKCNECKTSSYNEQATMETGALAADDHTNETHDNKLDQNQPTPDIVRPKKKLKGEKTLDEFAKDWIEHGNCWYEKDFEGFSLTFEDFKGVMHNVFHGKHVSDVELQQAWDKAVYAIQKDPTNINTQEIPLAGAKPKATAAKPLKSDFKTKVTSATPKSGTDSHENKVSDQQKRMFPVGTKVQHKVLGNGEVIDCNDTTMTVHFISGRISKLVLTVVLDNHLIETL